MADENIVVTPQETTEGEPQEQTQTAEEKMSEQFGKEEKVSEGTKEAEPSKEEAPKEDDAPKEEVIGDDWMPTLAEGMSVDEEALKEARTILKEMGISSEKAQKLAEFQAKQVETIRTKTAEAWEKQVSAWETDVKKDPLFKDDFEAKKVIAEKGFKELFSPEERQWLSETEYPAISSEPCLRQENGLPNLRGK